MPFTKLNKLLIALFCALTLAACETTPKQEETVDTSTEVTTPEPDTTVVTPPELTEEEKMALESEEMRKARTIYFEFDDTTVQSDYLKLLQLHAEFLMKSGMSVTLEGHADERGTPNYNLALGEGRANAVKTYMMNFGLSGDQIEVVSRGEEDPAVRGSNESAWEKNRRVEILYR